MRLFWSAHFTVRNNQVGHAETWDALMITGLADQRNEAVRFERAGRRLALATTLRDGERLSAELAMGHGAP